MDISSHAELVENTLREDNEKLQKKLSELKVQIEKNLIFEQEKENLRSESEILGSVHQTEKEVLHKEIQYLEGFHRITNKDLTMKYTKVVLNVNAMRITMAEYSMSYNSKRLLCRRRQFELYHLYSIGLSALIGEIMGAIR
ncbi:hypothetical protein V2W45_1346308 [Cenococcum geophilum]